MTNKRPQHWANDLTTLLNAAYGQSRFPVKIIDLAKDYSHQVFPNDPITLVKGRALNGFEGALAPAKAPNSGWGIFYNSAIQSEGRINFTLAHEFGHYLIHRTKYPDGMNCSDRDVIISDLEYNTTENEANQFAAALLMPLDTFRINIPDKHRPSLNDIGDAATLFGVSLIAATLRWLEYTSRRACLVVSRDGYILWSRSSKSALKTGIFFKVSDRPPIPVPVSSLALNRQLFSQQSTEAHHARGVWFADECDETVLFSDSYDLTLSLLHFEEKVWSFDEEPEAGDCIDHMTQFGN
jgi:IrrE N-terminal-like domain